MIRYGYSPQPKGHPKLPQIVNNDDHKYPNSVITQSGSDSGHSNQECMQMHKWLEW